MLLPVRSSAPIPSTATAPWGSVCLARRLAIPALQQAPAAYLVSAATLCRASLQLSVYPVLQTASCVKLEHYSVTIATHCLRLQHLARANASRVFTILMVSVSPLVARATTKTRQTVCAFPAQTIVQSAFRLAAVSPASLGTACLPTIAPLASVFTATTTPRAAFV